MTEKMRRTLEIKRQPPEYQRLDIEPKVGGGSLLHDEFGMPKTGPTQHKGDIPMMESLPNEPIMMRSTKSEEISLGARPQKFLPVDEDKFIPPKSNFVSVGNVDTGWYNDKVVGPSKMIDNNEVVDVESLQGVSPLAPSETSIKTFAEMLKNIKDATHAGLLNVDDLNALSGLRAKILGKQGVFNRVLAKFNQVPPGEKAAIGSLISDVVSDLTLEFEAKEYEFISSGNDPEEAQAPYEEDEDEDFEEESEEPEEELSLEFVCSKLSPGSYAVLVNDKLITVTYKIDEARKVIEELVLGEKAKLEDVQLIKKIAVDFGVILDD